MNLDDNVKTIKGIGDKSAALLEKLGITTVADLICHYPRDYESFAMPVRIGDVRPGSVCVVELGITQSPVQKQVRRLKILNLTATDGTGRITLTWFNQPFMAKILRPGRRFIFRGRISSKNGFVTMEQPKVFTRDEYAVMMRQLRPVYPLTAGLKSGLISKAVRSALDGIDKFPDPISPSKRKALDLEGVNDAVRDIHFPRDEERLRAAKRRLAFDEFASFMLMLDSVKNDRTVRNNPFTMKDTGIVEGFLKTLPYSLTADQEKAVSDITKDLEGEFVMNRLLEGDVGSGKTVVALTAMLYVCDNGYQCALMAPTEVLARQHFESVSKAAEAFGKKTVILTGSMKASERRDAIASMADGSADIVIGTHALISGDTEFHNLALVITDEQHRFGVHQRELLSKKGETVHTLVMSATPIPRSLAMILYGDLDISVLKTMPSDRKRVKNCVVTTSYRPTAVKFILSQIEEGRQAYIVCPMVEDDEESDLEGVIVYSEKLREEIGDKVRIEHLYGSMKAADKADIMDRFSKGLIDVLVSTTVIEVGINVPNATVMLVENAERFGLATLHQLRGRVGRGEHQSYCIFMTGSENEQTKKRLEVMNNSNDGFAIAEEDLKLRGPGDLFGIRQSGELNFKIADIYSDAGILKEASAFVAKLEDKEREAFRACPQYRSLQSGFFVVL